LLWKNGAILSTPYLLIAINNQLTRDSDVIEMSLAHSIKDATERAYRRGNLAEKRQRLMQDWADYCDGNL
jgi:integrase